MQYLRCLHTSPSSPDLFCNYSGVYIHSQFYQIYFAIFQVSTYITKSRRSTLQYPMCLHTSPSSQSLLCNHSVVYIHHQVHQIYFAITPMSIYNTRLINLFCNHSGVYVNHQVHQIYFAIIQVSTYIHTFTKSILQYFRCLHTCRSQDKLHYSQTIFSYIPEFNSRIT